MAFSSSPSSLFLCFVSLIFLSSISPISASCNTTFSNRIFASCLELPTLSSSLHWTYTSSNTTLTVAFLAPPAASGGWVSWGINPSRAAMLGTRALVAHRLSNGNMTVQTFNLSSYSSVTPSLIDYPVSGLAAEQSGSNFVIFAALQLPAGTTAINHVWQVGSSVTGSIPAVHAMTPANLRSVGRLNLVGSTEAPGSSPTTPSSPSAPSSPTTPSSPSAPSPMAPPATPGSPSSSAFQTVASWPLALLATLALFHILHH